MSLKMWFANVSLNSTNDSFSSKKLDEFLIKYVIWLPKNSDQKRSWFCILFNAKKEIFYLVRFSKMSFFRFFDGSLMASFWRLLVWSSTRSTCNRSQTHIIGIVVTFFRICRQSLAIMIYTKYMIIKKQL